MRQAKALATITALFGAFCAIVVGVCVGFFMAVSWAAQALAGL
ncbi:MAG TPA: hypothetical protein VGU24_17745 [Microvirga sp.]|jgi:uncharacterized protein YneF (UPF0154 family)|nr:hypothetical protein [Microvirga sp.]